jgi:hypothetical protein
MNNGLVVDEFSGMSSKESIDHQVTRWVEGIPLHNTVRDECCPDFSCCGSPLMPLESRQRLKDAHDIGDEDTVQSICMMGLSGLVVDLPAHVCTSSENTQH